MGQRINLQQELQSLIGTRSDGKQNVYFQPPESVKLVYPCIIYNKTSKDVKYSSNQTYLLTQKYDLTLITKDPDSNLSETILKHFKLINFNRSFCSDNLNHDVFTLYY